MHYGRMCACAIDEHKRGNFVLLNFAGIEREKVNGPNFNCFDETFVIHVNRRAARRPMMSYLAVKISKCNGKSALMAGDYAANQCKQKSVLSAMVIQINTVTAIGNCICECNGNAIYIPLAL